MKKCSLGLAAFLMVLLLAFPLQARAQEDDAGFNNFVQQLHDSRAQMEAQLGLDPQWDPYPQAMSYYDDMPHHYEMVQVMQSDIDEGII